MAIHICKSIMPPPLPPLPPVQGWQYGTVYGSKLRYGTKSFVLKLRFEIMVYDIFSHSGHHRGRGGGGQGDSPEFRLRCMLKKALLNSQPIRLEVFWNVPTLVLLYT